MNKRYALARRAAWMGISLAGVLALGGCASPQINTPVGEWTAVDDDHGTLSIHQDGTFTMADASFNPLDRRDADDDFDGEGTWRLARGDSELSLDFTNASQGEWEVDPGGFFVSFRDGFIRFQDPDEVLGIEFRIDTETPD